MNKVLFLEPKKNIDEKPSAVIMAGGSIRFNAKAVKEYGELKRYAFGRVGKLIEDENTLVLIFASTPYKYYNKLRYDGDYSGIMIGAGIIVRSLSYNPIGKRFKLTRGKYEGEPALFLKLDEKNN